MAAYLVFDAQIANTDRHHSTWAVIRRAGEPDRWMSFLIDAQLPADIRATWIDPLRSRFGGAE